MSNGLLTEDAKTSLLSFLIGMPYAALVLGLSWLVNRFALAILPSDAQTSAKVVLCLILGLSCGVFVKKATNAVIDAVVRRNMQRGASTDEAGADDADHR